jgi:hypothetical protein
VMTRGTCDSVHSVVPMDLLQRLMVNRCLGMVATFDLRVGPNSFQSSASEISDQLAFSREIT